MEWIGYSSTLLLGLCALPAVVVAYRAGKCEMPLSFLLMWLFGEIFGLVYVIDAGSVPLIINYTFNTIATMYLTYMRIR